MFTTLHAANEEELAVIAAKLATQLTAPCVIYLQGNLGVGKTTFVRLLLRALGYQDLVKSPSYGLVESYDFPDYQVYHFDLYRLNEPEELISLGIRDYCHQKAILLIEWPEKASHYLPKANLICEISCLPNEVRELKMYF